MSLLNDPEAMVRVIMVGTVVLTVVVLVFMVALQVWLKRQSPSTQARVRERITRISEESLKVLDGTAHAYAVVSVAALVLGVVGAILLIGLTLAR